MFACLAWGVAFVFRSILATIAEHGQKCYNLMSEIAKQSGDKKTSEPVLTPPKRKQMSTKPTMRLMVFCTLIVIAFSMYAWNDPSPLTTGRLINIGLLYVLYLQVMILASVSMILDPLSGLMISVLEKSCVMQFYLSRMARMTNGAADQKNQKPAK